MDRIEEIFDNFIEKEIEKIKKEDQNFYIKSFFDELKEYIRPCKLDVIGYNDNSRKILDTIYDKKIDWNKFIFGNSLFEMINEIPKDCLEDFLKRKCNYVESALVYSTGNSNLDNFFNEELNKHTYIVKFKDLKGELLLHLDLETPLSEIRFSKNYN